MSSPVLEQTSAKRPVSNEIGTPEHRAKKARTESGKQQLPCSSVKFCLADNQTYASTRDENDVKNCWITDDEEISSIQAINLIVQAYREDSSFALRQDACVRGLEQHVNISCKRAKKLQVDRFRRSVLLLQHDVDSMAKLSATLSATPVKEAASMAIRDAQFVQRNAAIEQVMNHKGGACMSLNSLVTGYSLFSLRKLHIFR
jgi:hypothetical protein